ncbi:hypothetical protein MKW94_027120, partial [Papaver nudicaule]|nr:hypothetical protein [Papaver nudicaule]
MRVSPWNQYQLVEEKSDPGFQQASCKAHASRGCACFDHASAGIEDPSPPKFFLKSSLKKPCCTSVVRRDGDLHVASMENDNNDPGCIGKRKVQWTGYIGKKKVQWTDTCGKGLAEIREFEVSVDSFQFSFLRRCKNNVFEANLWCIMFFVWRENG